MHFHTPYIAFKNINGVVCVLFLGAGDAPHVDKGPCLLTPLLLGIWVACRHDHRLQSYCEHSCPNLRATIFFSLAPRGRCLSNLGVCVGAHVETRGQTWVLFLKTPSTTPIFKVYLFLLSALPVWMYAPQAYLEPTEIRRGHWVSRDWRHRSYSREALLDVKN